MRIPFLKVKSKFVGWTYYVKSCLRLAMYRFLSLFTGKFTRHQREQHIAMALDSAEGRMALAQAMVEPLRRSLNYQDVGRSLFRVDELPQGAYARYERDPNATANDRADALALAANSFYSGDYIYNTNETPATADDIRRVQEQLAQTANDPHLTITTTSGFRMEDIVGFGHIWSPNIHISSSYGWIVEQENALYEYLIWRKELKEEEKMVNRRLKVINPIMEMEIGG